MDTMILIIGGALFAAIVLFILIAAQSVESKRAARSSLRAIESYAWQEEKLIAVEAPLVDRVFAPMGRQLTQLGRKFTPIGYVDSCRRKLIYAGKRGPLELDRFLAIRMLTLGAAVAVIPLGLLFMPGQGKNKYLMILALIAILVIAPDSMLNRQTSDRQKKILQSLPDTLDLLTISVEAGLGFEQAIDRITDTIPGPLTDEFNRMTGEMRAGASRTEALQGIDIRTGVDEVKSFVMSMVQADAFGVSIGRVLRAQADEMRVKRRQLAQERAMKAPVKMLLPMTFLIFPPLFIVLLGPAVENILSSHSLG